MIKIITIIGARPQIIKAAAISRAIKTKFSDKIQEIIVHTGQHYDENMSQVFFDELQIPKPNYNLNVGSGKHGEQTAKMITGIEDILETEKPDFIILYGDTNSTLAGAIAATKIHIPIIHIEAGLRSFNKSMPEEINRILTDHVSTFLFSPTIAGINNLLKEGFKENSSPPYSADNPFVCNIGDVMLDNSLFFKEIAKNDLLLNLGIEHNNYILCTIHRNNNTDEKERLIGIIEALNEIAIKYNQKIILPLHPRTKLKLQDILDPDTVEDFMNNKNIILISPISFLDMITLEKNAEMIITDSGGVQKEAFFFQKPCLILRPETEWVEIVENGAAILCDADKNKILNGYLYFKENPNSIKYPNLYGDGNAAEQILDFIINTINAS